MWVPDFVASAGGVIYTLTREAEGLDRETALARVETIEDDHPRGTDRGGGQRHDSARGGARRWRSARLALPPLAADRQACCDRWTSRAPAVCNGPSARSRRRPAQPARRRRRGHHGTPAAPAPTADNSRGPVTPAARRVASVLCRRPRRSGRSRRTSPAPLPAEHAGRYRATGPHVRLVGGVTGGGGAAAPDVPGHGLGGRHRRGDRRSRRPLPRWAGGCCGLRSDAAVVRRLAAVAVARRWGVPSAAVPPIGWDVAGAAPPRPLAVGSGLSVMTPGCAAQVCAPPVNQLTSPPAPPPTCGCPRVRPARWPCRRARTPAGPSPPRRSSPWSRLPVARIDSVSVTRTPPTPRPEIDRADGGAYDSTRQLIRLRSPITFTTDVSDVPSAISAGSSPRQPSWRASTRRTSRGPTPPPRCGPATPGPSRSR